MKKILCLVLAAIMAVMAFTACGDKGGKNENTSAEAAGNTTAEVQQLDPSAKDEGVMTYAQFIEAASGTDIIVEGFIQAKQAYSETYGNTSLYLADGDGAYFAYRVACTAEEYAKFEIGAKVKVTGQKAVWSGEIEIGEGCKAEVVGTDKWTAGKLDVTSIISNTEELAKNMNKAVTVKGLEIAASTVDGDATEHAFLYKHNGTGSQGDDLYFKVKSGETVYTFVVESDLCGAETEAYKAVEALKVGDKIDIEGFLYWYNAPQIQVTGVAAAK